VYGILPYVDRTFVKQGGYMNPEEAKFHCEECGDPLLSQKEINYGLCDECFKELKDEADYEKYKDEYGRDEAIRDGNCEL
jgi:hypothetical protein